MPVQVGVPFQYYMTYPDRFAGREGLIAFRTVYSWTWDCLLRRSAGAWMYMYHSFIHVVTGSRFCGRYTLFTMDYSRVLVKDYTYAGLGFVPSPIEQRWMASGMMTVGSARTDVRGLISTWHYLSTQGEFRALTLTTTVSRDFRVSRLSLTSSSLSSQALALPSSLPRARLCQSFIRYHDVNTLSSNSPNHPPLHPPQPPLRCRPRCATSGRLRPNGHGRPGRILRRP